MAQARVEVQQVEHSRGPVLVARVSESIAPGDYEALLLGLRQHPGRFTRKILLLDNIGGHTAEALRMGRLLRETGFTALVPQDAVCQGSCIYLLAAGRHKTVNGYVALHRPYFAHGDSAAGAGEPRPGIQAYLRDMQVPAELAQAMQNSEPARLQPLSQTDLRRYGLN